MPGKNGRENSDIYFKLNSEDRVITQNLGTRTLFSKMVLSRSRCRPKLGLSVYMTRRTILRRFTTVNIGLKVKVGVTKVIYVIEKNQILMHSRSDIPSIAIFRSDFPSVAIKFKLRTRYFSLFPY